jgi:hypothetical protein
LLNADPDPDPDPNPTVEFKVFYRQQIFGLIKEKEKKK